MAARFPTVFISHGAPTLISENCAARRALIALGANMDRPRAVLCVSAHWETEEPAVGAVAVPATIHDFFGFPEALYRLRYPAPGYPALARRVRDRLADAGFPAVLDAERGLDHGAWAPLMLMYPDADVPVVTLSIQPARGPRHHLAMGGALASLAGDGVLVLGSGGAIHNLRHFAPGGATVPDWALRFEDWLIDAATAGDAEALVDYRTRQKDGALAHPRDEHYLPLLVALGAAGPGARGRVLHRGFMHGALGMTAFAFDPATMTATAANRPAS